MVETIAIKELIATVVFSWSVSSGEASLSAKRVPLQSVIIITVKRLLVSTLFTAHLYLYAVMPDTMALVRLTELKALI